MRFLTAVALVMLWVPVDGVAQFRNPLTGLSRMDHSVVLDWHDEIRRSEQSYIREAEGAFELGLLRAGISLDEEAGPTLSCSANLYSPPAFNGSTITYTFRVAFMEGVVPLMAALTGDPETLAENINFAATWDASSVGIVGVDNLSGTLLGEWCAETFELGWRRANN